MAKRRIKKYLKTVDTLACVAYFPFCLRAEKETIDQTLRLFESGKMMGVGFCRLAHQDEKYGRIAHVAQLVEHVLGKDEVISSILIMGSRQVLI